MEMTHALVTLAWRPNFVLKHGQLRDRLSPSTGRVGPVPWVDSALNSKNRPDSLDTHSSRWRVDGATGCGTRFYAVPLDLPNIVPLRIFIYLPDQGDYPPALRTCLDSALSVPLRDGRAIASLGIAKHLCRAMDYHCTQNPGFLNRYQQLPFGSRLVFDNIAADVADMQLTVVPTHELESRSRSVASLQKLWAEDAPQDAWPPIIDIKRLHLVRQMHDTVSIVSLKEEKEKEGLSILGLEDSTCPPTLVFKSVIDSYDHLYHELHFLLTTPPHPHLMPRPLALVVKRTAFGGKHGVVGFLLPHFTAGSIRDILPARQGAGTLTPTVKLSWCQQITAALIHIHEEAHTFFADLRPDNVLLDAAEDGQERLVLCDFEQRGNWHEWSAPEVFYRQYVENIRAALKGGGYAVTIDPRWISVLDSYAQRHTPSSTAYSPAETPVQAANRAWFALSPAAREKATVYSLGLFIYTVFEGLSNVRRNIANKWPRDPDVEFPQFKRTPAAVQEIVMRCASDSESGDDALLPPRPDRVVRVEGLMYPESRTDLERDTHETADAVIETALRWWSTELERAEKFTESAEWQTGCFGRNRPTLREVMRALEQVAEDDSRDE